MKEGESETEGDISAAEPSTSTIQEPSEDPTLEEGDVEADEEYDEMSAIHIHATEWVESLSRDDLLSLAILLCYLLTGILAMQITEAAKIIGKVIGRSDRRVRKWSTIFNRNNGSFPDTLQGKYQRGVL